MSLHPDLHKAADLIERTQIPGRTKIHRFELPLPTGTQIKINGIPCAHLEGNTFACAMHPDALDIDLTGVTVVQREVEWHLTLPEGFKFKIGGLPFVMMADGWVGTGTDPKFTNDRRLAELAEAQRDVAPKAPRKTFIMKAING